MAANIYNIPASCSFVDVLAQKILDEHQKNILSLTDVLILLPNRRSCRELQDAFVRLHGMSPTLLPKMVPIGDIEEEEIFFANLNPLPISSAISNQERLLLFTRLITFRPTDFEIEELSFSQAYFLAQELSNLIDIVALEKLDFANLSNIVPDEYSAHWQKTLVFLQIITKYLPDILKERGLIDKSERQILLLKAQIDMWQKNPPQNKVIVAGTTASFPTMRELVKTVAELKTGEVYLSGLDKHLDDESWQKIDESHQQFELKTLIEYLSVFRHSIKDIGNVDNLGREVFISEVMRPAQTTDKWQDLPQKDLCFEAIKGLNIINCDDIRQEALTIALIMRKNLEVAEKTTALVTPDRNLARRVAVELKRWNILVDDSAGKPLSQTPIGIFFRLIAKNAENNFDAIDFLSLLKHPITNNAQETGVFRRQVRLWEKTTLRDKQQNAELKAWEDNIKEQMREFFELLQEPQAAFGELIKSHIKIAEALAATLDKSGADILWVGDDGEAMADLLSDLIENAQTLGNIPKGQYLELIQAIFAGSTVRAKFGSHPRLKILGPIEARLTKFDCVIIGEVNEGILPANQSSGAWLSRPMKKDFGFPLPEKTIGILAHDFSQLLAGKEVYLTRAERVEGTPMVKSRWLMRIETVLRAANIDSSAIYNSYNILAQNLDKSLSYEPISAPNPKPPLEARPRELWASAIENLMRDPYIVYARYILKLKPLDDIKAKANMSDFGNIVHKILEEFNKKYPHNLPSNAKEILLEMGVAAFASSLDKVSYENKVFWLPSYQKIIDWILSKEEFYRNEISQVYSEVSGRYSFDAVGGRFTIGAKADRIDKNIFGELNIIDYKTGSARTKEQIKLGYAPQLPIAGIVAQNGGFEEIEPAKINSLSYWQLDDKETKIAENVEDILDNNLKNIKELINIFDNVEKPYICQPNPKFAPKYSDYEHLSRIKEWGVVEDEE